VGTSARLLRLLSLLQTPRDWTGAELADRLEVSPRTIRTDIERLRSLGYPVHATRGAIGGYRLAAGTTLPPLLLEDDEAVALAVGLRTAAGGAVAGIEETSLRALAKLEQVLPARLRSRVNALQSYTVLVRHRREPTVDPDVLTVLAGVCRDQRQLRFDYEDRRGGASQRRAEPHRLVNWGQRWYLVAWDTDRADWRTFRVDRIRPHLPAGARFRPRDLSDDAVAALVSRGVPATARRFQARVTVHAPAAAIAERIGPWVGTVEAVDEGSCTLDTGADSLEILAVYLGMLDADFSIIEPPELVAHVKDLAGRYTRAGSTAAQGMETP
jgi:predicted DNA-binding transcriptional regulator YafY